MIGIEHNLADAPAVAMPNLLGFNPCFPGQILQIDHNTRSSSSGLKPGITDETVSGEIRTLTPREYGGTICVKDAHEFIMVIHNETDLSPKWKNVKRKRYRVPLRRRIKNDVRS